MIAFACVFLLKVTAIYRGQFVSETLVLDQTAKIVQLFRSTGVSKWHLSHQIANGLEKMAASKVEAPASVSNPAIPNTVNESGLYFTNEHNATISPLVNAASTFGGGLMLNGFEEDFNFSSTPFLHFDSGNFDLSFSGFGL